MLVEIYSLTQSFVKKKNLDSKNINFVSRNNLQVLRKFEL